MFKMHKYITTKVNPKNATCPLEGECLAKDIIYQATVTSEGKEETHVGVTATTFKSRLASHKASFEAEQKRNSTELSKHIWNLKDKNLNYAIKWRILSRASHYSIYNKEMQPMHNRKILYYKRNELINKCRHKEKFLLRHSNEILML